ncbi:MAG: hybrid sensor histidine kinase/response regulator [Campylobacterales bacterium]|nr:hybrid sensor histidine kinase/response regulator [Campylobacterales bacterium]
MESQAYKKINVSILVVEDSLTQAEEVRYFLEENGYNVDVCNDGEEALAWLLSAKKLPDVIVSDIVMPKMNGYDLCKAIRKDEKLKGLPVILLTSLSEPHDIIKSIEAGANKFLTKPFDHKRLPEVIDELYINTQRRSIERMEMGIRLMFSGSDFLITADKVQILDLLLSSYEESYYKNLQLQESRSALEKLNAELEQRVQERTKEVQEKDKIMMIQSRQAAMGDMIAMIAHQWRQPLSIVSMEMNNLRLSVELDEEITKEMLIQYTDDVNQQIQQLSQTIEDFRGYLKPTQDKEEVTIVDVLKKTMNLMQKSLENNNITVEINNSSQAKISTYPNQLLQVFINIINNAKEILLNRKVEEAKVIITINDTKDSILISVCDNGGGIPKEIIGRLGEPYFTTKETNGTGLGIYMSKMIVLKHLNGNLTWGNKNGGACFTIVLKR